MNSFSQETQSQDISSLSPHQQKVSTSIGTGTNTPLSEASSSSSTTTVSVASTNTSSHEDTQISRTQATQINFSALRKLFLSSTSDANEISSLWYILTTAILLSFHKEKLIGELWTYLISYVDGDDERLAVARCIREACLKASTLVGFPRAINALFSLKSAVDGTTPHLSSTLATDSSLRSPLSSSEKYDRGLSFFREIYRQHTQRVISAMDATSGGDLTHFAINCIYGELLSEHSIIGGVETGLLEFVCCLADGCGPQAKGHFFGSINLGAESETLRSTIYLTQEVATQLRMPCPWTEDPVEFKFLEKAMGKP